MWVLVSVLWAIRSCEGSHCRISYVEWWDGTVVHGCVGGKLDIVFDKTIRKLELRENYFTSLPANVFDGLTNLNVLDLSHNNITSLESNIFNGLTNLSMLDLSQNHITSLESNIFNGLPYLLMLDLSRNHITSLESTIFDSLTNLVTLSLFFNPITSLESTIFAGLPNVSYLSLRCNKLTELPETIFFELRRLETLDLSDNHLASLPPAVFAPLQSLVVLRLHDNFLRSVSFNAFRNLQSLRVLNLDGNNITAFPPTVFDFVPELTTLSLSKNLLATLPKHVFDALSNLTNLWLDHNHFTSLPEDIFANLPSLNQLVLESNRFGDIPCAVVTLPRNIGFSIRDNPFHPNLCLPEPWRYETGMVHRCKEELNIFPCTRQTVNCDAEGGALDNCTVTCVDLEDGDLLCRGKNVSISCSDYRRPGHCQWSQWSEWTDHCEGDCGLATATKMRLRFIEHPPLHGVDPCEGASVEAVNCNFPTCNASMYTEGSLLESAFITKEIFKERRRTCHEECINKCTVEDLCGDAPIHRGEVWIDPKWTQRWFGTTLSKFMAEVALGDSFEHPTVPTKYQPCLWLHPTCSNVGDCDFGGPFKKPTVRRLMDNFYHWYFSEGSINARRSVVGRRETFSIGGGSMKREDAKDPSRARCKARCLSWCYESCSCNWGWDFPWSNAIDLGWKHQKPMRFRWIPSIQRNPSYGTWKCVSSDGEPLRTPWDNPVWSMDIYSDKVKKMYEHLAPLQFHLVCDHVKLYYARQVCGTKVMKCPLNCTRAAQPVVDYLYKQGMLQPVCMQKGGKKRRAQLVEQLHAGIHSSCRRTCAEVHAPAFLHMYPDE